MTRKITIKSYGLWLAMAINWLAQTAHADSDVAAQIKHGEYLARAGDCAACHTAPGGKPFAGGLKMMTPVGAIYASNITPDKLTGIGSYSEQDFSRALRQGIAQDGHHLYPALPYPSFNKITDSDTRDLYLYFTQQVAPVAQTNRPSDIPFPLNIRWPLAVWNQVFTREALLLRPETDRQLEPRSLSGSRAGALRQLPYATWRRLPRESFG